MWNMELFMKIGKSISEIRTSFEKTWDIAANLDENLVANYIQ